MKAEMENIKKREIIVIGNWATLLNGLKKTQKFKDYQLKGKDLEYLESCEENVIDSDKVKIA